LKVPAPLDTHAHISPNAPERDLRVLGAFVFAATRSLAEYDQVASRKDPQVFRGVLATLAGSPRLVSVHTSGAQLQVLRELAKRPTTGIILHWWTGSRELTEEAVRLGCYFSVPPALMGDVHALAAIPTSRLLPETDHPAGDRRGPLPRQPGNLKEVELRLGANRGMERFATRETFWRNLKDLVDLTGVSGLVPRAWHEVLDRL
jgi:TatD DNase family protein